MSVGARRLIPQYIPGSYLARPECKSGRFPWYALSRYASEYVDKFAEEKIIYNKFQVSPKFSWDNSGFFVNDAVYFIDKKYKYLLPILNSRLGSYLVSQICYFIRGGYQLIADNFGHFPVPTPTPEQAARLAEFTDDLRLDELNALVYELYGLHAGEIALIEELTAGAYGAAGAGEEDDTEGATEV